MITDYASLKTEIASWMHRSNLTASIPTFIANAEARINRKLRVRQQETSYSSVALDSGVAALPTDFLEFKALWCDSDTSKPLSVATVEFVRSRESDANKPLYYAIEGSNVVCWPTSGNIQGVYYAKVPALSDSATTNWLITAAPDLYLAESLAQASFFAKDPARAAQFREEADRIREEMMSANRAAILSGGPLSVRVR